MAIKVLPEVFAKDRDRLARIERKAKLLAALDHANNACIHTIGIERATHFLAEKLVEGTDTKVILLPPKSPNLIAHIERYMRSMKSECLSKMIFFGEKSLCRALTEFTKHYHAERNHQGIGNNIIRPGGELGRTKGAVQSLDRLGGILRYYYREAA